MLPGERGALMEHQADLLLGALVDAGDVALERERRALPLDRFVDALVNAQDRGPNPEHRVLQRVIQGLEPGLDLGVGAHRLYRSRNVRGGDPSVAPHATSTDQRRSNTSLAGTLPAKTSSKHSLTCSSRLTSSSTRVRPAACSSNTSARSSRVPTSDPITWMPRRTVSKIGSGNTLSAGRPTRTRRPAGRSAANADVSGPGAAAVEIIASAPPSLPISSTTSCRAALITWSAPRRLARSSLASSTSIATVKPPAMFAYCRPRWPSPPIPTMPTTSEGPTRAAFTAL